MSPIRPLDRIVPPLLMAAGVTLVGAGLLAYGGPGVEPSAPPTPPAATAEPVPPMSAPTADVTPGPAGTPSLATPSPMVVASATRVVVPSLDIDLPVISRLRPVQGQGPDHYPPCNVALFHDAFGQPAEDGTTYLYAHAQTDMFLPLLEASRDDRGRALIGALIEVYTDDDRLYVYRVDRVKRHALDFSLAEIGPGERNVVLQTSEGPLGTFEKVQVLGELISDTPVEHVDAHPRARPRGCYPG